MLVEVQEDRMGMLLLTPVSKKVQAQMRKHTKEWTGHADDTVLIQRDYDVEHFLERYVPAAKRRDVREGWGARIQMDPWEFGHFVGYDFHEVIRP